MYQLLRSANPVKAVLVCFVASSTLPVLSAEEAATNTAPAAPTAATSSAPAVGGRDGVGPSGSAVTAPAAEPATGQPTPAAAATAVKAEEPAPKIMWKPGQSLETSTDTEDIVATYDVDLARRQVAAYADSPEAAFILAVALTRTSRVEEALKEVQRARKLAESKGGPAYFDKMIASYEKMLVAYPKDNQVRYGLAWAYYMKAYLLGRQSRKVAAWKAANPNHPAAQSGNGAVPAATPVATTSSTTNVKDIGKALSSGNTAGALAAVTGVLASVASGKTENLPHIPTALEKVDPPDIPQIKAFYDKALQKIDEILKREPNDIWSIVYSAHLRAEYTGNLEESMKVWRKVAADNPNNPAPFFFLGEGYLKQGNLKESINNVSKAIALRALGN